MPTTTWGPHVWTFIHTFCYHIDEAFFIAQRKKIISLLFNICNNVPCPFCEKHAKQYLSRTNIAKINTKTKCKQFFYDFHNTVNKRLNKSIFTNFEIYKTISLKKSFINFRNVYTNNVYLRNKLHKTFLRRIICNKIYEFISLNKTHFGY